MRMVEDEKDQREKDQLLSRLQDHGDSIGRVEQRVVEVETSVEDLKRRIGNTEALQKNLKSDLSELDGSIKGAAKTIRYSAVALNVIVIALEILRYATAAS